MASASSSSSSSSSAPSSQPTVELKVCWLSGELLAVLRAQLSWTEPQLRSALQQQLQEAGTLALPGSAPPSPAPGPADAVPASPAPGAARERRPSAVRSLVLQGRAIESSETVQGLGLQPGDVLFAIAELPPLEKSLIRILSERQHLTDEEACRLIVRADASEINVKDQDQTPLHLVCDRGFPRACRALLNHHLFTEANTKDGSGFTALHWAALGGWVEVCGILLDHARFTEAAWKTLGGHTALHLAAGRSHLEVIKVLVAHASFAPALEAKDNRGRTALDMSEGATRRVVLARQKKNKKAQPTAPAAAASPAATGTASVDSAASVAANV